MAVTDDFITVNNQIRDTQTKFEQMFGKAAKQQKKKNKRSIPNGYMGELIAEKGQSKQCQFSLCTQICGGF